jgi:hypothetical protein
MSDPIVLPPNKIAFVLDGKVVDIFHTEDRLAAVLLSNPTIVNVTAEYAAQPEGFNLLEWNYDGTTFTAPEVQIEMARPQDIVAPPAV